MVRRARTQRRADAERTVVTTLSEMKHNVAIDDAMFAKPEAK